MTSSRPYLIRALYEWIVDNGMTPHILVNTNAAGIEVPQQYIRDGRIVLNITPTAVHALQLGNELIVFSARFDGVSHVVRIPSSAVMAIYARENDQGMVFADEPPPTPDKPSPTSRRDKKPSLKVVK